MKPKAWLAIALGVACVLVALCAVSPPLDVHYQVVGGDGRRLTDIHVHWGRFSDATTR